MGCASPSCGSLEKNMEFITVTSQLKVFLVLKLSFNCSQFKLDIIHFLPNVSCWRIGLPIYKMVGIYQNYI